VKQWVHQIKASTVQFFTTC